MAGASLAAFAIGVLMRLFTLDVPNTDLMLLRPRQQGVIDVF
jgi:peptide deformylase